MADDCDTGTRHVWIATVEQDIGDPVIIPAASRLLAEEHAEKFVEDTWGERLGEWFESPDDGGSLIAFTGDRQAIIRRLRVNEQYPDGRSPGVVADG